MSTAAKAPNPADRSKAATASSQAAAAASNAPAQIAKAALRRLLLDKLEPTPSNYERAYLQESGGAVTAGALPDKAQRLVEKLAGRALDARAGADLAKAMSEGRWDVAERLFSAPDESGAQLADMIDRVVKGVGRGGRQWTTARKKESLQRVLGGSRSDAGKLQQRLNQLLTSWDTDTLDEAVDTDVSPLDEAPASKPASAPEISLPLVKLTPSPEDEPLVSAAGARTPEAQNNQSWSPVVGDLGGTVQQALPAADAAAHELAQVIGRAVQRIQTEGATPPLAQEFATLCAQADRLIQHRHHLVDQLGSLCQELTASLTDLAENDSWAQGQCEAMRITLADGLTSRGVKSVNELLRTTREKQQQLRQERERARDSLKTLINRMLSELGELGSHTDRFQDSVGRYADVIEKADSLESLAGVVREIVEESRTVQALVSQTQSRLNEEHSKAAELNQKVHELESELVRLAQEVSTDQLTQVANRRGLIQAFDAECLRMERAAAGGAAPPPLAVGLLDIDNFKKLNDELGHSAGDVALKSLAGVVSKTLRPNDMVARYGGEEFVVLLPDTVVDEGQQILTRLQRSLSGGLFMHEEKKVFVTFSAGVTRYRPGERIEDALERADQALYEAKRTGKNRTCIG
ncbi:MAG: diguanylate cyclase [Burkholderiales bacterium]